MNSSTKHKVMVAMSGGVDSSVSAIICALACRSACGATMKLFDTDLLGKEVVSGCCSLDDVDDAKSVCHKIGIEHYTLNCKREFLSCVVDPFVASYISGKTPNPCIACNRYLKFDTLIRKAKAAGFDMVATGHYANVVKKGARLVLTRGLDPKKDQSYVLHTLTQEQLSRIAFPIGALDKKTVREIASYYDLCVAEKSESQDICFIQGESVEDFISRYTRNAKKTSPKFADRSGVFVTREGEKVGEFSDYSHFTIGQRKGLNVALGRPVYVSRIDIENKTITVSGKEDLVQESVCANDFNWISITPKIGDVISCTAKIRYNMADVDCRLKVSGESEVCATFPSGVSAPAAGQSLVAYDGDIVLGGGYISA